MKRARGSHRASRWLRAERGPATRPPRRRTPPRGATLRFPRGPQARPRVVPIEGVLAELEAKAEGAPLAARGVRWILHPPSVAPARSHRAGAASGWRWVRGTRLATLLPIPPFARVV